MKKRIIQQALETFQTRVEDVKIASNEENPYFDAYVLQKRLLQELIDLIKSNTDALIDLQLIHWIDRQQHAGSEANSIALIKEDIKTLDSIIEKSYQMTINDFLEDKKDNER